MTARLFFVILALNLPLHAQQNTNADPWHLFRYFTGQWQGHETGKSGIGKGERTYEFILGGTYLLSRNTSTFEPQEKNPKGEVHQDWTIFSRDNNAGSFAVRQFNSEGFVNEFVLDTAASGEKTFVFVSWSSENAPPGLRARLTFTLKDANHFEELFELAPPGKGYSEWLRNHWERVLE